MNCQLYVYSNSGTPEGIMGQVSEELALQANNPALLAKVIARVLYNAVKHHSRDDKPFLSTEGYDVPFDQFGGISIGDGPCLSAAEIYAHLSWLVASEEALDHERAAIEHFFPQFCKAPQTANQYHLEM